jgi:tRNA-dihydrouridine synthase
VKFRAGWTDKELVYRELAKMAEDCGLNAIAIHARTREQGYSGQAQWDWIADLKQQVRIPVIGNGDIRSPEDAAAMVAHTACDAVMIGRSAASNPWIFRQIDQYTQTGNYDVPDEGDRYRMIRRYFQMLIDEGYRDAPGKMKQFASWFTHGVFGGAKLRKAIYESRDEHQILAEVDRFFETLLAAPEARCSSDVVAG